MQCTFEKKFWEKKIIAQYEDISICTKRNDRHPISSDKTLQLTTMCNKRNTEATPEIRYKNTKAI
uniref:Uncharacterized protein n=1 Tax=Octopus bimaculoides TaxID=37653 RepID=A0A0L8H4M0_OCTBM